MTSGHRTVFAAQIEGARPEKVQAVLEAAGGEVASFIGDRLFAVWPEGGGAAACAGALALARTDGVRLRGALEAGTIEVAAGGRGFHGEPVSRAWAMIGAAKLFGCGVAAGEGVVGLVGGEMSFRTLGAVRFVGSADAVRIFEPLGKEPGPWAGVLARHEEGVAAFGRREFVRAADCFREVLAAMPADGAGLIYSAMCEDYAAAPPQDWDGVINLTS